MKSLEQAIANCSRTEVIPKTFRLLHRSSLSILFPPKLRSVLVWSFFLFVISSHSNIAGLVPELEI